MSIYTAPKESHCPSRHHLRLQWLSGCFTSLGSLADNSAGGMKVAAARRSISWMRYLLLRRGSPRWDPAECVVSVYYLIYYKLKQTLNFTSDLSLFDILPPLSHYSCPFMLYPPIHHIPQPSLELARNFPRCSIRPSWDMDALLTVVNQRDRSNEPLTE